MFTFYNYVNICVCVYKQLFIFMFVLVEAELSNYSIHSPLSVAAYLSAHLVVIRAMIVVVVD